MTQSTMDSNILKEMPSCDRLLEELKNLYREYLNVQQSDRAKQEQLEQQNAKRIAAELREQRQQHAKAKKETDEQQAAAAAAAAAAAMNAQNSALDGEILSDSNDSHASDVIPSQLKPEDVVLMFDDLGVSDHDLGSTSDSDNELVDYLANDSQSQQQNRRRRRREQYRRLRISRIINLKKGLTSLNAKKNKIAMAALAGTTTNDAGAADDKDHATGADGEATSGETAGKVAKHDELGPTIAGGEKHDNNLTLAGQQQTAPGAAPRRKSDISTLLAGNGDHQPAGDHTANRGASDQESIAPSAARRLSGNQQHKHDDEYDDTDFDYDDEHEYAEENADQSGYLQQTDEYDWQKTKAQLLAKRARQTARARKRRPVSAQPQPTVTEQTNAANSIVSSASGFVNRTNDKNTAAPDEEAVDSDTLSYNIRKLQYAAEKCWSEAESGCCEDDKPTTTAAKLNAAMATPLQRPPPAANKKAGLLRLTNSNESLATTPNVLLDLIRDQHEWSDGVEEDEIELNQSDSDWSEVSHENLLDDLVDDLVDECFSDAWDDYCKRYFVPKQVRQYCVYDWAYKEFVKVFQWHTVPHDCGPTGTPSVDDFMRWSIEERDFYMHQPSAGVDQEPEPPQIDSWAPGCDDPLVQVPDAVRQSATQQPQQADDMASHTANTASKGAGDSATNNNASKRKI